MAFSWVYGDIEANGLFLLRTEGTLGMRWLLAALVTASASHLSKENVYPAIFISRHFSFSTIDIWGQCFATVGCPVYYKMISASLTSTD